MDRVLYLSAVGSVSLFALGFPTQLEAQSPSTSTTSQTYTLLGGSVKITNNTTLPLRRNGENYVFERGNDACTFSIKRNLNIIPITQRHMEHLSNITEQDENKNPDIRLFTIKSTNVNSVYYFGTYTYQYTIPTKMGNTVPSWDEVRRGVKVMFVMMGHGYVQFNGVQYFFNKGCAILGGDAEENFNKLKVDFYEIDKRIP